MSKTNAIKTISAITLAITDMERSLRFYRELGLEPAYGDEASSFASFRIGDAHLNLLVTAGAPSGFWGRIIFHVDDVDRLYAQAVGAGLRPDTAPVDAPWNERFFHIRDPDGHELSFAKPL